MKDKFYNISVCSDGGKHISFVRLPEHEARILWQVLNLTLLVRNAHKLTEIEATLERWKEGDQLPEKGPLDVTITGAEESVTITGLSLEHSSIISVYAANVNMRCNTKTYWASLQYFNEKEMRLMGAMDTVMTRHPVRFVAEMNAQTLPNKVFLCSWQEIDQLTYAALKEAYDFADTDQQHDAR